MRGDRYAVSQAIRDTRSTILLNAALPATNLIVMRACLDAGCDYIDMASGGAELDGTPKLPDPIRAGRRVQGGRAGWRCWGWGRTRGRATSTRPTPRSTCWTKVTEFRIRDGDNSVCAGHNGFLAPSVPGCSSTSAPAARCPGGTGSSTWRRRSPATSPLTSRSSACSTPITWTTRKRAPCRCSFRSSRWRTSSCAWTRRPGNTLKVLKDLGLSGKNKVRVGDVEVSPRDLVVSLLPEPKSLGGRMQGKTCVGHPGARNS